MEKQKGKQAKEEKQGELLMRILVFQNNKKRRRKHMTKEKQEECH